MTSKAAQALEGRQVCVALRNGCRIDDCQLVSAGRVSTGTLWLFSNGADLFVSEKMSALAPSGEVPETTVPPVPTGDG